MKSTAKTIGTVMIIMVLSRLLSLVSTQVYSAHFGIDTLEMDIYSYAITLPNVIFTILGTSLTTIVIPIFAGYIGTGDKQRAFRFADNIISLSFIVTTALALLCVAAAPLILYITPKFRVETGFAVTAFRIMFPVMFFYALSFILQGILQSLGKFNMPALVSVPSSLIVIGYVLLLGKRFGVTGLLIATFLGLAAQALILIPPVLKTEYKYSPSFRFKDEDIRKALALVPSVIIGTSAYQLNMLFNSSMASNFRGGVITLNLIQNLILVSVLTFTFSITSVIYPRLTMLAARNDMENFKISLLGVLKTMVYFLIPATAGFIAVRHQLFNLLYGWGKVTNDNVEFASKILALYALGITGAGIKEVVDRAFYSLKDTTKPAINGVIIMGVNIVFSLLLIRVLGIYAIPVAYSVSSITGAVVISVWMRRKIGGFGLKELLATAFKVLTASGIMLLVIVPESMLSQQYSSGFPLADKLVRLFIPAVTGAVVFYLATYLLKVEEAVEVLHKSQKWFYRGGK